MTQKVSNKRVIELLGLETKAPSYLDVEYYYDPNRAEWCTVDTFDINNPAWTFRLLEKYRAKSGNSAISTNEIIIAAFDALDKEPN